MTEFFPITQTKSSIVTVKSEKRIVGEIRPVMEGWQYFPKGENTGGKVFLTLQLCKNSLTEEDEE